MRRLVQTKKRNRRCERRLLLGVISIRGGKEFAFKIAFKTIGQKSLQTFGALTENALSAMTRDCKDG